MRTKLNYKQRQRLREKREHDAEIREALEDGEDVPECQICYQQLTSKNKVELSCEHNFYCVECIETWFKKSRLCGGLSLLPIIENTELAEQGKWKFPVYFQDCATFPCPTCRCEHTFLHQNKGNIKLQPKQVIAKVHFGDLLDRDPIFPIVDIQEFYCLIPQKYRNSNTCCINFFNPITRNFDRELSFSLIYIIMTIMEGFNAGDTEFYMRHPSPNSDDITDMIVTSESTEKDHPEFKTFRLFDVTELNNYYRTDN